MFLNKKNIFWAQRILVPIAIISLFIGFFLVFITPDEMDERDEVLGGIFFNLLGIIGIAALIAFILLQLVTNVIGILKNEHKNWRIAYLSVYSLAILLFFTDSFWIGIAQAIIIMISMGYYFLTKHEFYNE